MRFREDLVGERRVSLKCLLLFTHRAAMRLVAPAPHPDLVYTEHYATDIADRLGTPPISLHFLLSFFFFDSAAELFLRSQGITDEHVIHELANRNHREGRENFHQVIYLAHHLASTMPIVEGQRYGANARGTTNSLHFLAAVIAHRNNSAARFLFRLENPSHDDLEPIPMWLLAGNLSVLLCTQPLPSEYLSLL